ncbi:EndoU nuclease [Jatrophihabitans endophyticus]|uniref:EndoU nuclease n=1 Tax=Jatrophihabitans endophyticus TaxID=1206085 RepID=A0A1M5HZ66_9ACTN|nr:EndoU domain-containing protein [Jatrophihabitans endophyticus]SHG21356.1 EndoU nuclease [Jatrophihabitans endophyticus]
MTRLHVEIEDFVRASRTLADEVADPLHDRYWTLQTTLQDNGGMAGADPGGHSWAVGYDAAARSVLAATARLVTGTWTTAAMFSQSARNYAAAEAASTPSPADERSTTALLDALPMTLDIGDAWTPPTAAGAGGDDGPLGWSVVRHLVGYLWPNGDTGRLRTVGDAWLACGGASSTATCLLGPMAQPFVAHRLPEADDMQTVCRGVQRRLEDLGNAHLALGHACHDYADQLDHCHDEIKSELAWLAGESAGIQIVGAVASAFTLGGAEGPTQGVQAARIAAAAARIAEFIQKLGTSAHGLGAPIRAARATADEVRAALQSLASTRLVRAGVTDVRSIARTGRAAHDGARSRRAMTTLRDAKGEVGAEGRLAAGERRPADAVSDESRKHILDGDATGGGHRWPGRPGKTPFPEHWTDDRIIDNVGEVVSSPTTRWHVQTGGGAKYTRSGKPAVWRAWEVRDGVRLRVVWEPATGRIRSAFPDDGPAMGAVVAP